MYKKTARNLIASQQVVTVIATTTPNLRYKVPATKTTKIQCRFVALFTHKGIDYATVSVFGAKPPRYFLPNGQQLTRHQVAPFIPPHRQPEASEPTLHSYKLSSLS